MDTLGQVDPSRHFPNTPVSRVLLSGAMASHLQSLAQLMRENARLARMDYDVYAQQLGVVTNLVGRDQVEDRMEEDEVVSKRGSHGDPDQVDFSDKHTSD